MSHDIPDTSDVSRHTGQFGSWSAWALAVSVVGAAVEGDLSNRCSLFVEHGDGGRSDQGDDGGVCVGCAELDGDGFAGVAGAEIAVAGDFVASW